MLFRPTEELDIITMQLRQEDIREIIALGVDPTVALRDSVAVSHVCFTGVNGRGDVIAIGGVSMSNDAITPWMLASSEVRHYGRSILRFARQLMDWAQRNSEGRVIRNIVHKEHESARAFIRRVGFFIRHDPNSPFDVFYLPCVNQSQSRQ